MIYYYDLFIWKNIIAETSYYWQVGYLCSTRFEIKLAAIMSVTGETKGYRQAASAEDLL